MLHQFFRATCQPLSSKHTVAICLLHSQVIKTKKEKRICISCDFCNLVYLFDDGDILLGVLGRSARFEMLGTLLEHGIIHECSSYKNQKEIVSEKSRERHRLNDRQAGRKAYQASRRPSNR